MTERGVGALRRERGCIEVGPSAMTWSEGRLDIGFREVSAPLPRRLAGRIRLWPESEPFEPLALDPNGRHLWRPIAPRARVEVRLDSPALEWRGSAYFDSNFGAEPLERGFRTWNWCRAHSASESHIFYDVERRDGGGETIALRLPSKGAPERVTPPPIHRLGPTFWRMPRLVRADEAPRLVRKLEDAPFYTRSQLEGRYFGAAAEVVHESVDLGRLTSPVVRAMLPFRMPRGF